MFSFSSFSSKLILALSLGTLGVASAAPISLISREEGSGTRGAFVEIFDLLQKQGEKKIDMTSPKAQITNSTAVMLTTIARNKNAIGYVSLGALSNSVKALSIDGVAPSAANIKSKKYSVSRPFLVITTKSNPLADDFLGFIGSDKVQDTIVKAGYIPTDAKSYKPKNPAGKIVVAGSSSVTPLMEKLKELYIAQNPKATIEVQQSDSTTGVNATVQGIAHIGMVSRDLKDSELSKGIQARILAIDGLAVIVNPSNPIKNLSKDEVKQIFSGKMKEWAQ